MVVGVAKIRIHIPSSRSLKDKRQVMRSVLARVQREYTLSAAEVEEQDRWQIGVLGLAYVSNDAGHADEVLAKAVAFVRNNLLDGDVLDFETETLHL